MGSLSKEREMTEFWGGFQLLQILLPEVLNQNSVDSVAIKDLLSHDTIYKTTIVQ